MSPYSPRQCRRAPLLPTPRAVCQDGCQLYYILSAHDLCHTFLIPFIRTQPFMLPLRIQLFRTKPCFR